MNEKWFALPINEVEKKLKTNAASGLSLKAALSRKGKDEPFFRIKKKNIGILIVDLFSDFFLLLLTLVAFFTLFFESGRIIGTAVIILILIELFLMFLLHFRDRRSLESLSSLFLPAARVIRGGKLYILDYKDVVVGDVIIIEKGDVIGVDARLVYSDNLKVTMSVDGKKEKILEKRANGHINPAELYAENMENMIHAGSTVEEGSGRAIVISTGEYTYLGSMTGGLVQNTEDALPDPLRALRKRFSKISMILLIALLPFCIISLLLGNLGGTAILSQTLMLVLAFGATCRLSSFSPLYIAFFNKYIRKAAVSDNPCIIRSAYAFDKLADTDYIFVLDGSIATDGILHFEALETADGALKNLENITGSATELYNMISIYAQARNSAPSIGVRSYGMIDVAVEELLNKTNFDREALKIRCTVNSYLAGVDNSIGDTVSYVEFGESKEMYVSTSSLSIEACELVYISGEIRSLSEEGIKSIKNSFYTDINSGKRPIVFISSVEGKKCFVGMLVLREGLDYATVHTVNEFRKNGINVIVFSNCHDRTDSAPQIPELLKSEKVASFIDFSRRDIPVTFEFGNYNEYSGFGEEDVFKLATLVKSEGKTLSVIGFSNYARKTIDIADVFISCAPIKTEARGHLGEEITALEVPGEENSASCLQTVKIDADVLLMRPKNGKGGLEPMMRVMEYCKIAYRNLNRFLIYLFCAQIMRFIAVMFPAFFGGATADSRHLVMLGMFFDLFALFLFMTNTRRAGVSVAGVKKMYTELKFRDVFAKYKDIILCSVFGGILIVLLPSIFGYFNLFGGYIYKDVYTYMALMFLQLLLVACVYMVDIRNKAGIKYLFTRKIFVAELLTFVLFTVLCFIVTPIGDLFGVELSFVTVTPFYFLLTLVPAAAFFVCYLVMAFVADTKKENTAPKKVQKRSK